MNDLSPHVEFIFYFILYLCNMYTIICMPIGIISISVMKSELNNEIIYLNNKHYFSRRIHTKAIIKLQIVKKIKPLIYT